MSFEKLKKANQNKITDAACEMFARHGYRKASMKDIAEAAGISKSVLFKYFSTKENLYLYIFRLASVSIREADKTAQAEAGEDADLFTLMRRMSRSRLSLFKDYPWLYRFAYTAAFDGDAFVRELVSKELQPSGESYQYESSHGLRDDIPTAAAQRIIFWVSQGYLEEKLLGNDLDPDRLVLDFEAWIDILEKLLRKS